MKKPSHHAFRIFLHLTKLRSGFDDQAPSGEPMDETLPPALIPAIGASLDSVRAHHAKKDWMAYEMELFRLAGCVFSAIEAHQKKVGTGPFHIQERWYWEGVKVSGISIGASSSKAQAVAQAEAQLRPGEAFRVGRLAVSPVRRYVPKTEWLTEQMRRRAREEHDAPDISWPHLDFQQHRVLQDLFDGLLTAYFEREGALPDFTSLVDWEVRVVPGQSAFAGGPFHPTQESHR